ncbi:hypothetical protein [Paraclostridium bifermentans]|uniref:hypothetical protein n=1 Tax=Paraclostridium bifermentans TaxID=1490 RepID=UPI00242A5BD6|nr:hypothetical protein [Paraclostridium bifermentans]
MKLKELILKYDYLKNKGGINELEQQVEELQESKYTIKTSSFTEQVQTTRRTNNNRIENINIKIDKLQKRINDCKEYISEVDYFFNLVLKDEFKVIFDLYIKFKNERKLKDSLNIDGSTLNHYKRKVGEDMQMIASYHQNIFI